MGAGGEREALGAERWGLVEGRREVGRSRVCVVGEGGTVVVWVAVEVGTAGEAREAVGAPGALAATAVGVATAAELRGRVMVVAARVVAAMETAAAAMAAAA